MSDKAHVKKKRCDWVTDDPLYIAYHDHEWGIPVYKDEKLFEFLILEGTQAGLNWLTVLKKRAHYNQVFDQFDPAKIAHYNLKKYNALLQDAGIIRNRKKISATINNAKAYLKLLESEQSFADFMWQFVGGAPVINHWQCVSQVPVMTEQSKMMSRQLKRCGFQFVGPTICYAFMQAVGMVNDHVTTCFCYNRLG